jgi:hypothetical protein
MRICGAGVQGRKNTRWKNFQEQEKIGVMEKKGRELNDLAQDWATLNVVFDV